MDVMLVSKLAELRVDFEGLKTVVWKGAEWGANLVGETVVLTAAKLVTLTAERLVVELGHGSAA